MVGKGVNGNIGRSGKIDKTGTVEGLGISVGAARPAKPKIPADTAKPAVVKVVSKGVNGNIGRSSR